MAYGLIFHYNEKIDTPSESTLRMFFFTSMRLSLGKTHREVLEMALPSVFEKERIPWRNYLPCWQPACSQS